MPFGWTGKILRVDLSEGRSWREDTDPYVGPFVGGKGLSVKIMYDEVGPKVGPFDPANRICFAPGVLTGTLAPAHGRMKITSVSPNGLLQNAGIGGYMPAEIRKAGYDNLVIQGKSDKSVYLLIQDDRVEIKDASHIWGKDTKETQRAIKSEAGDQVMVACIGPAGENLGSLACIVSGLSAAGRGGFGAVMGSKNLKAVAVRGTGRVPICRSAEFMETCRDVHRWLPESSDFIKMQSRDGHGDKFTLDFAFQSGELFAGNWEEREATWDEIDGLNAGPARPDALERREGGGLGAPVGGKFGGNAEAFYERFASRQYGCDGCPVHHFHLFDIPGKGRGATKCAQWASFASGVWNTDREVIVQANMLCDDYGLDSTGTGNAVSFLMELHHRGIISEKTTDGIAMARGDKRAILTAVEKIGRQEGFGRLFKNGVWGAAVQLGKDAEDCAVVVHGQEAELYEHRAFKSNALAIAVADGSVSQGLATLEAAWYGAREAMEEIALERYGSRNAAIPTSYEKKALMVWDYENIGTAGDMLGTCRWLIPWGVISHDLKFPATLFSLATGRETDEEDLLLAAQRTMTLERAWRSRKGIGRDTLPKRLFDAAVPDGLYKGEKLDRKKFERMLDEYYELRGWDKNGIPKKETFEKFGLFSEWKAFRKHEQEDVNDQMRQKEDGRGPET